MEQIKTEIRKLAKEELKRANEKFPLFQSDHEGLAVISEEIWESQWEFGAVNKYFRTLRASVFKDLEDEKINNAETVKFYAENACSELVQVIAMCDKFIESRNERNG